MVVDHNVSLQVPNTPAEGNRGITRMFSRASDEGGSGGDREYRRLERLQRYEEALARMADIKLTRQTQLKDISDRYFRNERKSDELQNQLLGARHTKNRFKHDRIQGELSGLHQTQMQLDFEYMDILRNMMNEVLA